MTNAALFLHPDAYDTGSPVLVGRHSAGESFLRGFLRHADVERLHFWNMSSRSNEELEGLVRRIEPVHKPVNWIARVERGRLREVGVAYLPIPEIAREAWHRRPFGDRAYAICGITHTTATAPVMDALASLMIAPVEPYDALICTSRAVRASVETQIEAVREHLEVEYGPRRRGVPQLATIPLGVNVADFQPRAEQRAAWRQRLGIPDDGVAALYVGRFNVYNKMNPALMAMALERAAQSSGRRLWWINSGWGETPEAEAHYHDNTRALCPSVEYVVVDGRVPDTRFSIWSAADLFISLSDNIQETFGLTPVEAMAAGLPCVVSDWNGYRDTVRHEVDGFRIPTFAPRPGLGRDLAFRHSNRWASYENYVGSVSQFTAVDLGAAEQALTALVLNPDLRKRMGAAAQAQARAVFDWSAIIPQYQALWAEQNARRCAAPPTPPRPAHLEDNPWRMDPFRLFGGYPTEHLTPDTVAALSAGMTLEGAKAVLAGPLAAYAQVGFPKPAEVEGVIGFLACRPHAAVAEILAAFPEPRRYFIERGLLWMARFGVIEIYSTSAVA